MSEMIRRCGCICVDSNLIRVVMHVCKFIQIILRVYVTHIAYQRDTICHQATFVEKDSDVVIILVHQE